MCCDSGPVAEMLDRYRDLQAGRSVDWGQELGPFILQFCAPMVVDPRRLLRANGGADFVATVRAALAEPNPGTLVAQDGVVRPGPRLYAIAGHRLRVPIAIDDGERISLSIVDSDGEVELHGERVRVADAAPSARLRLRAGLPCRWSVVDDRGGAWFPDDRPPK